MNPTVISKIQNHPQYRELRRRRDRLAWTLTASMLAVYYGFVALIAFDKPFLARPIGDGVTTLGIPLGMGVIVFTVVLTGLYVRKANREFDAMTAQILDEVTR
jgi:uncharacterized membrane protein (DUF485 family)